MNNLHRLPTHTGGTKTFASQWQRGRPRQNPGSAGWHCLWVCEWKTWRLHGVRHGERSRRKNTSWSPLSHALHSLVTVVIIRLLKPVQRQRGNRGPVIGEDMKLPAQTSVAGARVGFVWLRNLGVLCINTHIYINPHTPPPLLPKPPPSHQPTPPLVLPLLLPL